MARGRATGRRGRRWPSPTVWTLAFALMVAAGSFALWTLYASPLLEVRYVAISGATSVPASRIRDAAGVPTGVPLARIDADAVRREVGVVPQVATVAVDRQWPHTLHLTVVERTPVFLLAGPGEARFVDRSGAVFPGAPGDSAKKWAGLPELRSDDGTDGARARAGAAGVLDVLPSEVRRDVEVVEVASAGRVSFLLRDGRRVAWGEPLESGSKSAVLHNLLKLPARVYDVSVPDVPTTR